MAERKSDRCSTCRFWLLPPLRAETVRDQEEDDWGWCRRFPPRLSDHMASMTIDRPRFGGQNYDPSDVATPVNVADATLFPATFGDRWCGEWATGSLERLIP